MPQPTTADLQEFMADVLRLLSLDPDPWRLAFLTEWAHGEGIWARQDEVQHWNPLATTDPTGRSTIDIGNGPGKWNNANPPLGVGIYADRNAGVFATQKTLRNGYYPRIMEALDTETITDPAALAANIHTWGTDGFAIEIENGWRPPTDEPVPVTGGPVFDRMPAEGPITGTFGEWYPGPPPYQHRGVDIGCPAGTPVYAPAPGVVVVPTNDGSFGLAVCIDHGTEPWRYSLYAHNSALEVAVGEHVERGQRIATSGATGRVTGAHCHFQLCKTSTFPVDIAFSADPLLFMGTPEDEVSRTEYEDMALAMFAGSEQMAGRPTRADRVTYALGRIAAVAAGSEPSLIEVAGAGLVLPRPTTADAVSTRLIELAKG